MKLAIYDSGTFVAERDFAAKPVVPGKPYRKFYTVEVTKPDFAPATQVRTGPVITEDHEAETRTYTWTVRDKTAEELDADKDVRFDTVDMVAMKLAFNHENRIRVLEGKQEVTAAQFKNAVKAML